MDRVVELKKQTLEASGYHTSLYPGLCGYLQSVATFLAADYPNEALEWLIKEANTLEADLPFVILKHSGQKDQQ